MEFKEILKAVKRDNIDVHDYSTKGLFDGGQQFRDTSVVDLGNENFIEFIIEVDRKFNSVHFNDSQSEEITVRNYESVEVIYNDFELTHDQNEEIENKIKSILILK